MIIYFLRRYWWVLLPLFAACLFFIGVVTVIMVIPYYNTRDLERRALKGDSEAQRRLAHGYDTGNMRSYSYGRIPRDKTKALEWYTRSAQSGNAKAAFAMARLYEREQNLTEPEEILRWYRRAADGGESDAAMRLATIYREGLLGKAKNPKLASEWKCIASKLNKVQKMPAR